MDKYSEYCDLSRVLHDYEASGGELTTRQEALWGKAQAQCARGNYAGACYTIRPVVEDVRHGNR